MVMNTETHWYHVRILFKNTLENMHAKTKLDPDSMEKDDPVVNKSATKYELRKIISMTAGGKSKSGLISWYSEISLGLMTYFQIRYTKIQVNSPKAKLQHCKNGC